MLYYENAIIFKHHSKFDSWGKDLCFSSVLLVNLKLLKNLIQKFNNVLVLIYYQVMYLKVTHIIYTIEINHYAINHFLN